MEIVILTVNMLSAKIIMKMLISYQMVQLIINSVIWEGILQS